MQQENKKMFEDYQKFKNVPGRKNAARVEDGVFILYRIKDGFVLRRFEIATFKTLPLQLEKRQHSTWNYRAEFGTANIQLECPFCGVVVTAYIWSLAGGGKRCPHCRVIHTGMGLSYADEKAKPENFKKS